MSDRLFELRRRTFEGPEFRGMEFIEVEAKSIINAVPGNRMPFKWTINPYRGCSHACTYCFARATHTFLDMDAGRDFERKIVVKVNAPERLRAELRAKRWTGEHIAMGTATDPYQRAEGRYRLMPNIIEALTDYANPFSILTKGTLILRDLHLLLGARQVAEVTASLSIPTLDEDVWRASEPGTPHPRRRLEAVEALNRTGIPCGVMVAPVLPGLSDDPAMLRDVVRAAVDAGATHVTPILLHLRPVVREEFRAWLDGFAPHLSDDYDRLYERSAYGPPAARSNLANRVSGLVADAGGCTTRSSWRATPRRRPARFEQLKLI